MHVRRKVDPRRYRMPDDEDEKRAAAYALVDENIAADLATAMAIVNNPHSWPDRGPKE